MADKDMRNKIASIYAQAKRKAWGQAFHSDLERNMYVADYLIENNVIEVCRCGQCRHATDDIIVEGVCYCHKIQQGMFLDGFCSYGERKCEDE